MVQLPTSELNKLIEDAEKSVRDSAYIVVGLGVLGFQRGQVRRRELLKRVQADGGNLASQVNGTADKIGEQLRVMDHRVVTTEGGILVADRHNRPRRAFMILPVNIPHCCPTRKDL